VLAHWNAALRIAGGRGRVAIEDLLEIGIVRHASCRQATIRVFDGIAPPDRVATAARAGQTTTSHGSWRTVPLRPTTISRAIAARAHEA
jgi:hypothetical protein